MNAELAINILLFAGAFALVVAGMAGLLLPAIPGAPLLFGGLVLLAWAEDFEYVGGWTLGVLAALSLLTYVVDVVAGAFGAKKYGASGRAMFGAAVGAVVGIFFGLIGVFVGPFVGALIAEFSQPDKTLDDAGRAGYGATIGLLLGTALKMALAFTMIGIYALVRFL